MRVIIVILFCVSSCFVRWIISKPHQVCGNVDGQWVTFTGVYCVSIHQTLCDKCLRRWSHRIVMSLKRSHRTSQDHERFMHFGGSSRVLQCVCMSRIYVNICKGVRRIYGVKSVWSTRVGWE